MIVTIVGGALAIGGVLSLKHAQTRWGRETGCVALALGFVLLVGAIVGGGVQ